MREIIIFFLFLIAIFFVLSVEAKEKYLRNPSVPLSDFNNPKKKLEKQYFHGPRALSLVFIDGTKKIAIINNKEYREGDFIGSYAVKKINIHNVLLRSSVKTKVLELYPIDKSGFIIK